MKTLGDVIKIETGEQLNKSDMLIEAEYPVVNGGIDFSGYTDKYNNEANTITISQGGASAGYVNWLDQKFWAGAHCYVVTPLPGNDLRFLYHFIKSREYNFMNNQQGAGIPSLNRSEVFKTPFPDFELEKQKEIAVILDSFTSLITNLESELASRQKQYEYYRNKLLTFNHNDNNVEWMQVKNFADLKAGKAISASELSDQPSSESPYPCFGGNGLRGYLSYKSHSGEYPIIGRQGALCGCVNWAEGDFYATEHAVVCTSKNCITTKYMFYLFVHADLNQYKSQGAQPGLSVGKLNELVFPVPTLERQQEIVSTLDTFESLITNIKQEIEARKKQYEYYREKLLTFE